MSTIKHVAIIMDGNGRWAKERHLPRIAGHRAGAKAVKEAIQFAAEQQIQILTLFAFSTENRSRPVDEVADLMELLSEALYKNLDELHEKGVRLRVIGDRSHFSEKLSHQIDDAEKLTANNRQLCLVLAINYSGRWDIAQAARKIALTVEQGLLKANDITEAAVQQHISLGDCPEPDLLIRTSGEQRISNFMLWQLAYTELFFTPKYWPDFNKTVFKQAVDFYQTRERRFGLVSEQLEV